MKRSSAEHAYTHSHTYAYEYEYRYTRSVDRGAYFSFTLPVRSVSGFLLLFTRTMGRMCRKNMCVGYQLPQYAVVRYYIFLKRQIKAALDCFMHAMLQRANETNAWCAGMHMCVSVQCKCIQCMGSRSRFKTKFILYT